MTATYEVSCDPALRSVFIIRIRAGITLMSNLKSCKILDTVQVVVNVSAAKSLLSA